MTNKMQEVHDYIEEQLEEGHITPDTALELQSKVSDLVYFTIKGLSNSDIRKIKDKYTKDIFKILAD